MRERRRSMLLSASAALLHFHVASGQLRVVSPPELARQFIETDGFVYGRTAPFGAPYWGDRLSGQLVYTNTTGCNETDYGSLAAAGHAKEPVQVLLLRRGVCTFVTKARLAQEKAADAVIVVDTEDSTVDQIRKFPMSDDGFGATVKIPSMLVSRLEGQRLIQAAAKGPVSVELAWGIPHAEVVLAEFWMSSGSHKANEFLVQFKSYVERLRHVLEFVPHYHIYSLVNVSGSGDRRLCVDENFTYCAPDPDGPDGPATGADVVFEDVRQLCLHGVALRKTGSETPVMYSAQYWEYLDKFYTSCFQPGRIDEECSSQTMDEVGSPKEEVRRCVVEEWADLLDNQLNNQPEDAALSHDGWALRLNGWRYRGDLDPKLVVKAVCSGYDSTVDECQKLLQDIGLFLPDHSGRRHHRADGGWSWGFRGFALLAFCTLALFLAPFYLYRRHQREVIREEAMLEVHTQMADYAELQDAPLAPAYCARTLTF